MRKTVLPVVLATLWIILSEFIRNEYIVKHYWVDHFRSNGLVFPSGPVNGAVWALWSLLFAIAIFRISRRASFHQTFFISWQVGFLMMWVVIGNLGVLPYGILAYAVPLSLVEAYVATWLIFRFS